MIPKRYIPSDTRRMEAYRRIAVAQSPGELERITAELKDAYGEGLPPATVRLLGMAELRALASALNVRAIAVRGPDVILRAAAKDAAAAALLLRDDSSRTAATAGGTHVTVLAPKSGEELSEVYFRPPAAWMEPGTLLGVLRRRLNPASAASAA
jgi:transcription-repair coupling factor (superfamily II helicase)